MSTEVDSPVDCDVAVVGAGPSGLVLAVLLAQRGRSVVVLEQRPAPYTLPRAVHFDDEVGRLLQSCGIGKELRAVSEAAEVYEWRNAEGTTLLRFGRVGTAASGWPFSSMFCQPELEALIASRVGSLPTLEIRRGVTVESLEQHEDLVAISCSSGDTVRARFVVGCDGANSTVRELLDIGVDDRGFCYDWLIVDVILDERRVFDPINLQVCDPTRPTTAVSGGPGRRRWEFMRLPDESREQLSEESTAWKLLEPWDVHPGNARIERHAVYTFQARVADRWQDRRAFIAGDAAHLMPPFAGQGMCSGIRDAANLAFKLELVLAGRAAPEVLTTYEEERRQGAVAAVDTSIALGQVICVADPAEAAARDAAMAAAVTGEVSEVPGQPALTSGLVDPTSPQAGEQLPQANLSGQWFDDVHGAGWRLVTDDSATATFEPPLLDWFASIGGAVIDVADTAPDLTAWFRTNDARWALQRPDFYIYGTATDATGAAELVEHLPHAPFDHRSDHWGDETLMATYANTFGPLAADDTYIAHEFEEQLFDTGEAEINYATAGDESRPAILLIPGQTESWWGYEEALPLLAEHFQAFAVDLRGQGHSSRTPGRYTLDLMGNDLVRFIDGVIGRPTIVAGLSSGGVISAWLSAYAKPGQVVGAYYEDPPLFSSDVRPAVGQSIRQSIGPLFAVMAKYLGDQWSIGDWDGMLAALPAELPEWLVMLAGIFGMGEGGPPQALKEYDPEWGQAFWTGTFYGSSGDHERMLRSVKVPVLFTHHFRMIDETTGALMGASSDLQVSRVNQLVTEAGQPFEYVNLPQTPHSLHGSDPHLYVDTLVGWADSLPNGPPT